MVKPQGAITNTEDSHMDETVELQVAGRILCSIIESDPEGNVPMDEQVWLASRYLKQLKDELREMREEATNDSRGT